MEIANLLNRLSIDPHIQHGKPCIKNTRIPVYIILESLAVGLSIKDIINEYPPLTTEDIHACIAFGALLAKEEEVPLTIT